MARMPPVSVDRGNAKPQDYASDGTDAIGFVQFWGTSPALDLLGDPQAHAYGPLAVGMTPGGYQRDKKFEEAEAAEEAAMALKDEDDLPADPPVLEEPVPAALPSDEDGPVNILLVGAADVRHVLKTISRRRRHIPGRRLRLFLHESSHEVLARHMLFIQVLNNTRLPPRERMEILLSLVGNTLVRERDEVYVADICKEFVELVTDNSEHPLASIIDFTHLKFRDRDVLQEVFKGWGRDVPYDVEALREARCRGYYRERFDYRKNMMDWDYQNYVKDSAGIIHWQHYKAFCHTGVAFETRLGVYDAPNRTLASYTEAKDSKKGHSVQVRGFWGDIINSPYHTFGTATDPQDWSRMFKVSGTQYRQTESDVAEFNVQAYITEMDTGEEMHLPDETPGEHQFPYQSPLDNLRGPAADEVLVEEEAVAKASAKSGGRRQQRKSAADWPALSAGFEGVEIVLLSGDLKETLKKPRYRRFFHRAFVGSMAMMPIFEDMGLVKGVDPGATSELAHRRRRPPRLEIPELLGQKAEDSSFASVMAPGAEVVFETMKYQAHFEAATRLSFRLRLAQVGHLAGWALADERHAVPYLDMDVQERRTRELERDATDFVRFVVPTQ